MKDEMKMEDMDVLGMGDAEFFKHEQSLLDQLKDLEYKRILSELPTEQVAELSKLVLGFGITGIKPDSVKGLKKSIKAMDSEQYTLFISKLLSFDKE